MQKKIKIDELTSEMIEMAQKGQIKIDLWKTRQTNSDWNNTDKDAMIVEDIVSFEVASKAEIIGGKKNQKTRTTTTTYAIGRSGKKEYQHTVQHWEGEAEPRSNRMETGLMWYIITESEIVTPEQPVESDIYGEYKQLGREVAETEVYQNSEDAWESNASHYSLTDDEKEIAADGFGAGFISYVPPVLNDVMTPGEAVEVYHLAEATVRQAINRGQIFARKSGGTWLIRRADAEARWKR